MAQYDKLINLGLLSQFLTKAKTIFAPKITASGILKGDGQGGVTAATAGTDYGTYSKPSSGIPKTDLASDVQTSLEKADTALQQHQSLAAYRTASAQDVIDAGLVSAVSAQSFTEAQQQQARNNIGAIDAGSIATIESSPATQAHAVGDYIVYNGQLYKVTAAIAQGESLSVGTNIRSSKVADQIRTYATGLKVINPNGNNFIYFLDKNGVLNALGRTEVDMDKVYVTAQNAAWSTEFGFIQVTGVSRQSNTFIAHLSDGRTGNMKIAYAIFYSD